MYTSVFLSARRNLIRKRTLAENGTFNDNVANVVHGECIIWKKWRLVLLSLS